MKNFKKMLLTGTITAVALFAMSVSANAATTIKVTADTLNIRKGPSTDTSVVAMLSKGVECEVLEEEGNWYKIKYQNYTGYVSKDYVEVINQTSEEEQEPSDNQEQTNQSSQNDTNTQENQTQQPEEDNQENQQQQTTNQITYKKFNKNADIKILPLIYSSIIGNGKPNQEVLLITETSGWSYIQTDTISGWVRSDTLEESKTVTAGENTDTNQTSENEETTIGYINEDLVNVRKGAGTSNAVIKVLTLNSQVTILGEENGWYQVKSGEDTGYVLKEYISNSKKTTSRSSSASRVQNIQSEEQVESKEEVTTKEQEDKTQTTNNTNQSSSNEDEANSTNTIKGTDIVAYAKKFLGYPYVYGGDGSNGTFDCSGYTMYVYKHFGISLPHGATSQYKSNKGTKIAKQEDLQTGDIVFLTDYETGVGIGHCGIYIGNGNFIHASTTTYTVTISSLQTMYAGRFYAGLRLI